MNESIKTVIANGRAKIDELQSQLSESYKENINLNNKLQASKSALVLEQKTKGMTSAKKEYISNLLNDKSPSYIEENFKFVVEMFEREETESASKLVEEATRSAVSKKIGRAHV